MAVKSFLEVSKRFRPSLSMVVEGESDEVGQN